MNREEMTLLGFEIVAYAGDARSKLLEALKAAENGDFAKADSLVVEAGSCIAEALTILRQLCWLEKLLGRNFHTALP